MPKIDFETLFRVSPNPYVLLDRDFVIHDMNEAYLRVTMRSREDILGRNMFEAFPSDPSSDSHIQLRASLERVVDQGERDELPLIKYDIRSPDGGFEERYWSATHTPLFNSSGAVGYVLQHTVDVTELHRLRMLARDVAQQPRAAMMQNDLLRRAEALVSVNQALHQETQQLRALFRQAPGFVAVLTGPEHVFAMANEAYSALVGGRRLIGLPVHEALPEVVDQGFVTLLDTVYRSGEPFVGRGVRVNLNRPDDGAGGERYVDFVYQPIMGRDGATTGIFVQGHDVTDQRRAEEDLALRVSELDAANAELQRFAYVVSHDLRAPLVNIMGFTMEMENALSAVRRAVGDLGQASAPAREALEEDIPEAIRFIRTSSAKMDRLIAAILKLSREGRRVLAPEPLDMREVLLAQCDLLAHVCAERGAEIVVEEAPAIVSDRLAVEQVFSNLLENAVKYLDPARPGVVRVSGRLEGDQAVYEIRDNGRGIDPRDFERIFDLFRRAGAQDQPGEGIGLAHVRALLRRLGGSISVQSEPGAGSVFLVTLPQRLAAGGSF